MKSSTHQDHTHIPWWTSPALRPWATTIEGMIPIKLSQLNDDLNLMLKTDIIDYSALSNTPTIPVVSYPVTSVNAKKGDLTLSATDIGAAPSSHTHTISSITGLQTALDLKLPTASYRRQEVYSGVTDSTGNYTVVFTTPFPVAPNVQTRIIGATYNHNLKVVVTTTGFTVTTGVRSALTVAGLSVLSADVAGASGISVDVLVTAK